MTGGDVCTTARRIAEKEKVIDGKKRPASPEFIKANVEGV